MTLDVNVGSTRRVLAAVLLTGLAAGCGGTVTGQGNYLGAGAPTTSTPPTTASSSSASESTEPTSESPTPSATTTATTTPTTVTTTSVVTTTTPPPPPPGEEFNQDGWVVDTVEFSDSFGFFDGTARITNTADAARSGLFTFTLFKDEALVATLIGTVTDVPPGDTVTATLISGDTYVAGPYSIDFQVDFSF